MLPSSEWIPALMLCGGALLLGIYHLILYLQYRERIIFRYSLYLFSILLYTGYSLYALSNEGIGVTGGLPAREAINFIAILCYASFLMEIAHAWKGRYRMLFTCWKILSGITLVFIGLSLLTALFSYGPAIGVINLLSGILKIIFVAIGIWATVLIYPRLKGRFVNLVVAGALVYLFFMAIVMVAMYVPSRTMLGLSPMQWFYLGTFVEILVFTVAMSVKIKDVLERVNALRSRLSRDLHDEVGATLTSISFLSEVAGQPTRAEPERKQALEKIGEYSREMITEMGDIVWSLNPGNDSFEKVSDRMKNFGQTLLSSRNISFHFHSAEALDELSLNAQQRKNLYLVFKEAVNNAVKYSSCSELHVDLDSRHGSIMMKIRDNGKGFDPAIKFNGNGMKNMRERAKEVDGELVTRSAAGSGTTVELVFPLTQNA